MNWFVAVSPSLSSRTAPRVSQPVREFRDPPRVFVPEEIDFLTTRTIFLFLLLVPVLAADVILDVVEARRRRVWRVVFRE